MERVGRCHKYLCVSYRNEQEKANLLYWQVTCEAFNTPAEWEWWFEKQDIRETIPLFSLNKAYRVYSWAGLGYYGKDEQLNPWDFRSEEDLKVSLQYEKDGYVIEDADYQHLESMKRKIVESFAEFTKNLKKNVLELEQAHTVISHDSSNISFISWNHYPEIIISTKAIITQQEIIQVLVAMNLQCRRGQEFQSISLETTMTYCQYTQIHGMEFHHLN